METKTPMQLSDFKEWRADIKKLTELQHSLNANAEKQRLHPPPEATESIRSRAATELLDGKEPAEGEQWAEELAELQREGHVIEEAIRIQRGRMDKLKGRLSEQICKPLMKRHRALVADVIDALKALARANKAEGELRRQLELGDVQYLGYLRPMSYKHVGSPGDINSDISRYLKSAASLVTCPQRKRKRRNGAAHIRARGEGG